MALGNEGEEDEEEEEEARCEENGNEAAEGDWVKERVESARVVERKPVESGEERRKALPRPEAQRNPPLAPEARGDVGERY